MAIEDFKRWHWIVIGVLLGGILVYTHLYNLTDGTRIVPGDGVNYRRTISAVQFIGGLQRARTEKGYPWIRNVTIYPPVQAEAANGQKLNKSYVSGEQLEIQPDGKGIYKPFQFYADVPFQAGPRAKAPPAANYTIRDYVNELSKTHADAKYSYAWWSEPLAVAALWGGGSVLVIGGLWPIALGVMIGAGFGRKREPKPEDEYDLDRFGKTPEPEKPAIAKAGPSAAEQQKLKDLQETLERNLAEAGMIRSADGSPAAGSADLPPPGAAAAGGPVRKLDGKPLEAMPAGNGQDEDPREYKGEFYPVARPASQPRSQPEPEEARR